MSLAIRGARAFDDGTNTFGLKILFRVCRWLEKDPWSACDCPGLGFIH